MSAPCVCLYVDPGLSSPTPLRHWPALSLLFMMNMELPLRKNTLNDNSYGIELIRFGGQYVMSEFAANVGHYPLPHFASRDNTPSLHRPWTDRRPPPRSFLRVSLFVLARDHAITSPTTQRTIRLGARTSTGMVVSERKGTRVGGVEEKAEGDGSW